MYLSRVDLRAGEGIVVGTHLELFPPTVGVGLSMGAGLLIVVVGRLHNFDTLWC
jgi:hypothetical protein